MADFSRDNYIQNVDTLAKVIRKVPKDSTCSAALKSLILQEIDKTYDLKAIVYTEAQLRDIANEISSNLGWDGRHLCSFIE